jgi:hypothetical protein
MQEPMVLVKINEVLPITRPREFKILAFASGAAGNQAGIPLFAPFN